MREVDVSHTHTHTHLMCSGMHDMDGMMDGAGACLPACLPACPDGDGRFLYDGNGVNGVV